ncbi:hypothetical protein EVAR_12313_1 [Eumeta japonica]|uniref:Uncharacterized protein n=1 Tax=Eumeta variegata TaxID=151549 RepID=A0A4C1TUC0_EUMVA|nr:hypothetical protein EVAR_12313_1 [Eumeta japonica]
MDRSIVLIINIILVVKANGRYEGKLSKLWSMSEDQRAVVNVTTASIVINPKYYSESKPEPSRFWTDYAKRFSFKPRAIPLRREDSQLERSVEKSDILFPGDYVPIPEKKALMESSTLNPNDRVLFHPKVIPLYRNEDYGRSMGSNEPIIEKPEGYVEQNATRRFISGDDDDDEDEEEVEVDLDGNDQNQKTLKKKKFKKKYAKYMLPLLLAYKLKFFTLIPLLISGLVLLVGATGMAGFFFALFTAVMGLQKASH